MKDLKEISSKDLIQELELRGWYTQNLWHVDDVLQNYECTSDQAMTVLEDVLASQYITDEIFRAIDDQAEHMEYHRIYDNDEE